jgi:hypothetical protein
MGDTNSLDFKIGVRNFYEHYYKERREVHHISDTNETFIVSMAFFSVLTTIG